MIPLPWGAIEAGFKFATLLLESVDPAQRRAQLVIWFWLWWPVAKLMLKNKAHQDQIEQIMASVGVPPKSPAAVVTTQGEKGEREPR